MKRYLSIFIFSLISLSAFCQIGGSSGVSGNKVVFNEQWLKICYSDGSDTLSGYILKQNKGDKIFDISGNEVIGGFEVDSKYCGSTESCVKSQTLYSLVDNTGTSFANENTLKVYFTDGTSYEVTQTPQSGWTAQLQAWDDLITELMEFKCSAGFSVETRFNPPPFTSTDLSSYTPPDGLLVPAAELWGKIEAMKYRYLNIGACSTCPAINQMEVISINGVDQDPVIPMTFQFEQGQAIYYDLCKTCGEEGTLYYQNTSEIVPESDKPLCLFTCGESFPPVPESGCTFTIRDDLCDLGVVDVNGNFKPVTVRYTDCGDGQVITDVFEVDPVDGSLVNYSPIGNIGDCTTGTVIDPPSPIILLEDVEKNEICFFSLDGSLKSAWQVTSVNTQGDKVVIYEDETGEINEPSNWVVGKCDLLAEYTTTFDSEFFNSAFTVPVAPANTKEVVIFNNSNTWLSVDTNYGMQVIPPFGTIEFSVNRYEDEITFNSISVINGTFGASDNWGINYKTQN